MIVYLFYWFLDCKRTVITLTCLIYNKNKYLQKNLFKVIKYIFKKLKQLNYISN